MFKRSNRVTAIAFAIAIISCATAATAAADTRLERWRSYSGVSWETPKGDGDPAPFAGSVNAPIAGLHFDARGAAYVSTPRFVAASTPATLSRLDTRSTTGPAQLTPFPSMEGNAISTAPAEHLRNVLGFYVDRTNDWLWALDMGFVAGESEAPPGGQKIFVFDLKSGRIVKRIGLDGVADRAGSFLNDIVVDERRRVAYVSDSGSRSAPHNKVGLIVADFASGTARRVLDGHPDLQVEAGVKVVSHGAEVWPGKPLLIGINGIALSPDGTTLYWTVTTGTRVRSVSTAVLRRHGSTDEQIAAEIRDLGAVGGNTDGMVTDSRGALYITDVTHNGIVKYEPRTGAMSLIASDDGVHWPDTPAVLPNGDLVFTSSALSDHVAGRVASGHERYELWRMSIGGK
ncbi:SMP-30/gluconolactonase/LRE family protein [Burkholderia ambifaria]|uniref:L-dopachrome tautomerase-related protein n=1 Tax=Burkholderia ambifaria TaxID=152480 RepID=UPI00158BEFD4|nr:L-dopachrome tautomerase-related protein [Burkholderia ambifaria]MBR8334061.1 SMP-30/gluconolactonase/LRE family protein [Burkholderia ambifaria]